MKPHLNRQMFDTHSSQMCACMNDHHRVLWRKLENQRKDMHCDREKTETNPLRHPSVIEKEERQAERQAVTANGGGGGGGGRAGRGVHKLKNSMWVYRRGLWDRQKKRDKEKWRDGEETETGRGSERQSAWESDRVQSWEGECVGECESSAS